MKRGLLIALALTLVISTVAFAGANTQAKVAIHVRDHNAKAGCTVNIATCADIVTTLAGFSFDAFPVFYDLTEYTGCEMGVTWPAWTYSAAFTSCSDFVIGAIVNPGDGSSHTWTNCQTGVCVPCFMWLYADGPGTVCPIPFAGTGQISVLDCAFEIDEPMCVNCAGVYGAVGDDPCRETGTAPSTWGQIKGMFE